MPTTAVKKVTKRILSNGFSDTYRWLRAKWETNRREKLCQVCTSSDLETETPIIGDCVGYEPVEYEVLDSIFQTISISESDQLLDYGSGLGRVLIEGAQRPFEKVYGVEHNPKLFELCQKNIDAFLQSGPGYKIRREKFELFQMDAQDLTIPSGVSHIFLWNSFIGEVLTNVAKRIATHCSISTRPIHLVLVLPSGETDSLRAFDFLTHSEKILTNYRTGTDTYWLKSH